MKQTDNLIGPHEGKEFELMQSGQKKLALFEQDCVPDSFQNSLADGTFHLLKFYPIPNLDYYGVIIYAHGYETEAKRLQYLLMNTMGKGFQEHIEREIGQLLGYSEEAIQAYIDKMSA